eukprot:CAMPEP_0197040014 /NCGR_PEP_ID=MMETSP1384-20130603/16770_1 /TAXON_ID=29189 /ORGANISM="Ammonia sp." /LENGTH=155 /DNA_ID=CAMNT_0042470699 /DNA_START=110 /DNA_END=580 /DNA_ORIENTATION=-
MKLKGNTVSTPGASTSILMKNMCSAPNKYEWSFKIEKLSKANGWNVVIGIWKVDSGAANLNHMFLRPRNKIVPSGYAFIANLGKLANPDKPTEAGEEYGVKCKKGDVVTMRLDLDRGELCYSVDGTDYGPAFKVERTKYRAALTVALATTAVTLL